MKKSDLKTGMRVKPRKGGTYIVLKDCETRVYGHQDIMFIGLTGFMAGDSYKDDLTASSGNKNYDIVMVYQSDSKGHYCNGETLDFSKQFHCIWERENNEIFNNRNALKEEIRKTEIELDEMQGKLYLLQDKLEKLG